MEEALRGAGALRFRDIPPTTHHHTTSTHPIVQIPLAAQHDDQVIHERQQDFKLWKKPQNHEDWVEKKRGTLMVVASLIATMAFQAGINPPGGVWQENNEDISQLAGTSVMADMYSDVFHEFINFNTAGLIASLSIILLLISGLPMRHRIIVWILMVTMWVAITAMALTYIKSLDALALESEYGMLCKLKIGIIVWLSLMGLLLLVHTVRLLKRGLKKLVKLLRRRRNTNTSAASIISTYYCHVLHLIGFRSH
ncbi:PREDICTED: uncharacterized protein LOC104612916 [Nelumbo nucifera]|uniref:Uncharacterized protein LOC104612916 n=1 Tax=Nelumbo nucifera TaxID=4432 RepID=A0A1U8BC18_NELNU|nr:PREDICTED: uncharacterized protein LOC104612916 [Nelumbo nucifera]